MAPGPTPSAVMPGGSSWRLVNPLIGMRLSIECCSSVLGSGRCCIVMMQHLHIYE
jgi:hypothetical protein